MKCPYSRVEIALFVEDDLSEGDRRRVERHLLVCETCRAFAAALGDSQAVLKSLGLGTLDPSVLRNVRQRVLGQIEATEASLGWALRFERAIYLSLWRRYALAGAAAILILAVLSGIMWDLEGGPVILDPPTDIAAVSLPDIGEIRLTSLPALGEATAPPPRRGPLGVPEETPTPKPAPARHLERLALEAPVMAWQDLPLMLPSPLPSASIDVSPPVDLPDADAPDQVLVKMLTGDPDIVVYWVVEEDGAMGPESPDEGGV